MKKIYYDFYCSECESGGVSEERPFDCPDCNNESIFCVEFVVCDCGERVYIPNFTNVCKCGKLYNGFGQELAEPEEMDPEEAYATLDELLL